MTDLDFETRLMSQLREYAVGGVRPIDALAIANATIATGRTRAVVRWPSVLGRGWPAPVLLGLLLLALAGAVVVVGSRLLAPTPIVPLPRTNQGYQGVLVPAPDLLALLGYPLAVTLQDGRVLIIDTSGATVPMAPEVFDPSTGEQVPTGSRQSGSACCSAAQPLRDGRVLLVGTGVAEIFDPGTLRFTAVGSMITPRAGAELAMLPGGRVLIAGGSPLGDGNTALASAEIFDPSTGLFTATGSMRTPRSAHSMAPLPDGRVLVVGGATTYPGPDLSSAEVYDASTGTFRDAGSMSTISGRMSYLTSESLVITLPDGRVLAYSSVGQAEIWDHSTGSFSVAPGPPVGVTTASLLNDGRVLLTGVTWAGIYDPRTGQTQAVGQPHAGDAASARLADGRVLLLGGHGPQLDRTNGNPGPWLATMEIFQ